MFVILGATGKVGGTTITALRAAGMPVRAVVRDRANAGPLVEAGCEIAVADVQEPVSLAQAIGHATAVQVICPAALGAKDARGEMTRTIASLVHALDATRPPLILAISDYGAEVREGTGITLLFHKLEVELRRLCARLIFLRSAEHIENWSRVFAIAAQTGRLPSMHHPLTKPFPAISAHDVGRIAADLLLSQAKDMPSRHIVHSEGPQRYTPAEVAAAMSVLTRREIAAYPLARAEWDSSLRATGMSDGSIALVSELYEAHNNGRIDIEAGQGEVRHGKTTLVEALKPLVPTSAVLPIPTDRLADKVQV
jgi:NAD(P)H dehydrogenase (quinone)